MCAYMRMAKQEASEMVADAVAEFFRTELKSWLKSYNKPKILPRYFLYTLQSPVLHEKCQSWASWWGTATSLCDVHSCTVLGMPTAGVGARGKRSQVSASSAQRLGHPFLLCSENGNRSALLDLLKPWSWGRTWGPPLHRNLSAELFHCFTVLMLLPLALWRLLYHKNLWINS